MALASTSVLVVENAPQNGRFQQLYPEGKLQLPPDSLGYSPRSAGGSDPGSFQITSSALGPGACEILCASFESRVSISYSPLALPKVSLTGHYSQTSGELVFPKQDPQVGDPSVGLGPPRSFGENFCNCNNPPIRGSLTWEYRSYLCMPLPLLFFFLLFLLYFFSCR